MPEFLSLEATYCTFKVSQKNLKYQWIGLSISPLLSQKKFQISPNLLEDIENIAFKSMLEGVVFS